MYFNKRNEQCCHEFDGAHLGNKTYALMELIEKKNYKYLYQLKIMIIINKSDVAVDKGYSKGSKVKRGNIRKFHNTSKNNVHTYEQKAVLTEENITI